MITLAICDDKAAFRKNITAICRTYFETKGIEYRICEYVSGEEFLMQEYPDILISDVRMKRVSGIMVKDILARMQADTKIIFVAENKNDITEAFGRNVYGYLIKPLKYDLFCRKMDEILEDIYAQERYVFCKRDDRFEKVFYKNILYIESSGKATRLYVQGAGESKISNLTIGKWEKILDKYEFARCSKKHIVNVLYVTDINHGIKLVNWITIPLGESYRKDFMEKYYADKSKRAVICRNDERTVGGAD